MADSQEFCLRWSSYHQKLCEALRTLLDRELFVDVTLSCEGQSIRAHRAILSACSNYFQDLFEENKHPHPIVILTNVRYDDLEALIHFMYHGEVTINTEAMQGFLRIAETLKIQGLTCSNPSSPEPALSSQDTNDAPVSPEDTSTIDNADSESNTETQREGASAPKKIKTERASPQPQPETQKQQEISNIMNSLKGIGELITSLPQSKLNSPGGFLYNQGNSQTSPLYQNPSASFSFTGRPFRHRVMWNPDQLRKLEEWYNAERYPSGQTMIEYANFLASMNPSEAVPCRQNVDYWFQNRRRRDTHPEVVQQREKKKLSKNMWMVRELGSQNGMS